MCERLVLLKFYIMNRNLILFVLIGLVGVFINACNDNGVHKDSVLESFDTIMAAEDTLRLGDSTEVTVYAKGKKLKYLWQTNNNAPLISVPGADTVVLFYADPCIGLGESYVYCKIIAENKEEEKKTIITIAE